MDFETDIKLELEALQKQISELEAENGRIKEVIKANDLEEELEDIDCTSLEEKICIDGIRDIALKVEAANYDDKDIKNFDTLYRTLRSIRGQSAPSTKKNSKASVTDLLKIVSGNKK